MRLIDADALLNRMQKDPLFDLVERYGVSGVIEAEPTVTAIPVQFITDKINSLEYLQKKMAHWTKTEIEVQMKTLSDLIYDYAQIARWKNVYEWAEREEE